MQFHRGELTDACQNICGVPVSYYRDKLTATPRERFRLRLCHAEKAKILAALCRADLAPLRGRDVDRHDRFFRNLYGRCNLDFDYRPYRLRQVVYDKFIDVIPGLVHAARKALGGGPGGDGGSWRWDAEARSRFGDEASVAEWLAARDNVGLPGIGPETQNLRENVRLRGGPENQVSPQDVGRLTSTDGAMAETQGIAETGWDISTSQNMAKTGRNIASTGHGLSKLDRDGGEKYVSEPHGPAVGKQDQARLDVDVLLAAASNNKDEGGYVGQTTGRTPRSGSFGLMSKPRHAPRLEENPGNSVRVDGRPLREQNQPHLGYRKEQQHRRTQAAEDVDMLMAVVVTGLPSTPTQTRASARQPATTPRAGERRGNDTWTGPSPTSPPVRTLPLRPRAPPTTPTSRAVPKPAAAPTSIGRRAAELARQRLEKHQRDTEPVTPTRMGEGDRQQSAVTNDLEYARLESSLLTLDHTTRDRLAATNAWMKLSSAGPLRTGDDLVPGVDRRTSTSMEVGLDPDDHVRLPLRQRGSDALRLRTQDQPPPHGPLLPPSTERQVHNLTADNRVAGNDKLSPFGPPLHLDKRPRGSGSGDGAALHEKRRRVGSGSDDDMFAVMAELKTRFDLIRNTDGDGGSTGEWARRDGVAGNRLGKLMGVTRTEDREGGLGTGSRARRDHPEETGGVALPTPSESRHHLVVDGRANVPVSVPPNPSSGHGVARLGLDSPSSGTHQLPSTPRADEVDPAHLASVPRADRQDKDGLDTISAHHSGPPPRPHQVSRQLAPTAVEDSTPVTLPYRPKGQVTSRPSATQNVLHRTGNIGAHSPGQPRWGKSPSGPPTRQPQPNVTTTTPPTASPRGTNPPQPTTPPSPAPIRTPYDPSDPFRHIGEMLLRDASPRAGRGSDHAYHHDGGELLRGSRGGGGRGSIIPPPIPTATKPSVGEVAGLEMERDAVGL